MVQSLKHLYHKHEDLDFDPQNSHGMMVGTCNLIISKMETEKAHPWNQLCWLVTSEVSGRPCLKQNA